jgi:hypothetical protein
MSETTFAELDALSTEVLRGPTIDEAVALWRELGGHGYDAESEPLLRAAFIDYLLKHPDETAK